MSLPIVFSLRVLKKSVCSAKGRKKRNLMPKMSTIQIAEGPDETRVSDEIKFLEEKYVGNDLHVK